MFVIFEKTIITIYQALPISVVMTVMILMIYLEGDVSKRLKAVWNELRSNKMFLRQSICIFYIVMLSMQTILFRKFWNKPLEAVMGGWYIHCDTGWNLTAIGNILMFIPYIFLFFGAYSNSILKNKDLKYTLKKAFLISFLSSLLIETIQLIFHLGTFQFSDLTYNTFGGLVGGFIYWLMYKLKKK